MSFGWSPYPSVMSGRGRRYIDNRPLSVNGIDYVLCRRIISPWLGGFALTFCSFQGEVMHWSEPMWIQIIRAVLFLTSLEFVTGIICNKWLKIGIWDYRDQPFQLCGQICLPFVVMFSGLLCLAIVLGGVVLWGVYGEEKPEFHVL